jgi:hypothetical protein
LKAEQVIEIRKSNAPAHELMERYGISESHLYHLRQGCTWKHLL